MILRVFPDSCVLIFGCYDTFTDTCNVNVLYHHNDTVIVKIESENLGDFACGTFIFLKRSSLFWLIDLNRPKTVRISDPYSLKATKNELFMNMFSDDCWSEELAATIGLVIMPILNDSDFLRTAVRDYGNGGVRPER